MQGTNRCDMHGGKSPQVQRAVARRAEEAHARTLLERLGAPEALGQPIEELLAIAAECRAWLVVLRERVAELSELSSVDKAGAETERAVAVLYERSLDRTARVLVSLANFGLDERLVRLTELQSRLIVDVFRAVLDDPELGVDEDAQDRLRAISAKHLRLLARGAE